MDWQALAQSMVPNLVVYRGQMRWITERAWIPRILLPSISHMQWQAGTGRAVGPDTLLLGTTRMQWRASTGVNRRGNPPGYAMIAPAVCLMLQSKENVEGSVHMMVRKAGETIFLDVAP
jgi:hypothetical protein